METIIVREAAAAMDGELVRGDAEGALTGVSTDTRSLRPGDLFFALVGENSDGHEFAAKAIECGAGGVVVSKPVDVSGAAAVIRVPDVLAALGDLAGFYRKRFKCKVVAVTGSVGKTTTKEMIAQVLERRWNVLKNTGNFNNEIGLPYTIFGLTEEHDVAVLEMAMRGPGEIKRLCEIAAPEVGVITNVGITHIERLGSRDAIAQAKAELLDELPENGTAVLNADDDYYAFLTGVFPGRKVSYGYSESADVRAVDVAVDSSGCASFGVLTASKCIDVRLDVIGEHNAINALAAVAVGTLFDTPMDEIGAALAEYAPPDKRANVVRTRSGATVLDDTYNASPASVISALKTLRIMNGSRRIAVLGDMLELGDHAPESHAELGRVAVECGVNELITVGPLSRSTADGAVNAGLPVTSVKSFDTSEEAGNSLKAAGMGRGDVVLVKGSRAMKMEKIVEALIED